MKQAHYLTSIQQARHSAEATVALIGELDSDFLTDVANSAQANLTAGLAALAALPPHPLRGGQLVLEMAERAEAAIATLRSAAWDSLPVVEGPAPCDCRQTEGGDHFARCASLA